MKRIAVLLSGRGSNFEAIARAISSRSLAAEISVVISNRADARGLERARELGLSAVCILSKGVERQVFDAMLHDEIARHSVDLICLAGYMRLLSGTFTRHYPGRIVNIHPSLLPAFPGLDAQHQALVHGVKFTGCTAHFVDEGLDSGPIIRQAVVPVLDDDTTESLSARILEQEHRIYPEAIGIVLSGRYRLDGRRVLTAQT
jgi:phosphoribosylglycinamide formyltransferase-1